MSLEEVYKRNKEHRTNRAGWLRAAVLGANDGLVSTAALMIGVAAAGKQDFLITAGIAGITAGAMSMAIGEYISVRSQNDVEESDRALQVAREMHRKDPLEAHLRDELGQHPSTKARPIQAAAASAISFTLGGLIPFVGALVPVLGSKAWSIVIFTLAGLIVTGAVSAQISGSKLLSPTLRVLVGGSIGMAITAGIGKIANISGI
jgi:vacuolar iron transporter family protein